MKKSQKTVSEADFTLDKFEAHLQQLEKINRQISSSDTSLVEQMTLYKQGIEEFEACQQILELARIEFVNLTKRLDETESELDEPVDILE